LIETLILNKSRILLVFTLVEREGIHSLSQYW